jgi:phosphoglycolate phosphatase-like HAD superfamily hydrolase
VRRRTIVLDLDGTLIDVSKRHHTVYRDVLADLGGRPLPFSRYWELKRANAPWPEILGANGVQAEFLAQFRERIEQPSYLALDRLFTFTRSAIDELAGHDLYLLTARRSPEALREQLDRLDLARHFRAIVSGERKSELITTIAAGPDTVVVGDTEVDVAAAREVGAVAVAVASGIRSEAVLRRSEPDHLAEDIRFLPKLLCE